MATTGDRHTYNGSPLLMTPLAIGSNTIRGYEDSVVISLPFTHWPDDTKRAAKTPTPHPRWGVGEPWAPSMPTFPAANACSHPGRLWVRGWTLAGVSNSLQSGRQRVRCKQHPRWSWVGREFETCDFLTKRPRRNLRATGASCFPCNLGMLIILFPRAAVRVKSDSSICRQGTEQAPQLRSLASPESSTEKAGRNLSWEQIAETKQGRWPPGLKYEPRARYCSPCLLCIIAVLPCTRFTGKDTREAEGVLGRQCIQQEQTPKVCLLQAHSALGTH